MFMIVLNFSYTQYTSFLDAIGMDILVLKTAQLDKRWDINIYEKVTAFKAKKG